MAKLAIDGGTPVFSEKPVRPAWPPVNPATGDKLREVYMSHKWSFYGENEVLFNERYAEFTGAKYAVMMANGTVTLECALIALGVGPGDEVIVPAHTWLATGEAVVYVGATPVIVDIEPTTLCMDPAAFEAAITPRTKAVIPVHLFGSMADLDKILAIANKHGIKVIEDCAHAHGGEWKGRGVGSWGDAGSWSFQQSKLLTSGEGGAITTNDEHLWEVVGRLSHIGYQRGAKQGEPSTPPPMGLICHNYRVTEFQAIILLDQLETLRKDTELRAKNADYLREKLEAIPGIRVQTKGRCATLQSYYMYGVMVDDKMLKPGIDIKQVCEALKAEGVLGFNRGWGNVMYRQRLWSVPENMYRIESNQVAEQIVYKQLLIAGLNWLMAEKTELDRFVEAVAKVMDAYRC